MSTYVSVKNRGEKILMCLAHARKRGKVAILVKQLMGNFFRCL